MSPAELNERAIRLAWLRNGARNNQFKRASIAIHPESDASGPILWVDVPAAHIEHVLEAVLDMTLATP